MTHGSVPTVKIKHATLGHVVINESDYDPKKGHELYDPATAKPATAAPPVKPNETLVGSSKLDAMIEVGRKDGGGNAWPMQLGEVVASAHKRSKLSVSAWNKMGDEQREKLLLEEVQHLTTANAAFK